MILQSLLTLSLVSCDLAANFTNETEFDYEAMELFWSYGRHDEVLPSPQGSGFGGWAEAYAQAREMVSQLTNEQKANLTSGIPPANGCSGFVPGIESVDFPGLCLQDAGNGVRGTDFVNAYPAGIHAGATWNRDLVRERGDHMGAEFKRKGVSVALGPVIGPIGKRAKGGRNWEGFSTDPYMASNLAAVSIDAMQQHVIACAKHFVGNEQEAMRNRPQLIPDSHNQSISTNIDDKTMHELYLWPFQDAVKAGVGSVMSSYNRLNNSYASQNSKSLNGLLKTELGFQGFVVSDWDGQHTGLTSYRSGLDMAMPTAYAPGDILEGLSNGTFTQERLDDMSTRILASWFRFSDHKAAGQGLPKLLDEPHDIVDARDPASKHLIFQTAVEGHVLVKNEGSLPLNKPKYISVFGYDAVAADINTYNEALGGIWIFTGGNTLTNDNGTALTITDAMNIFLSSTDPHQTGPGVSYNGTLYVGGGSGSNSPSYIDSPLEAISRQAFEDDTYLSWDVASQDPTVNAASEACLVFINGFASEGYDKPFLRDEYSDGLVENVASQCSNTIVVIHNAGIRLVDTWYDHENVTAIIYAHLPGQDSGRSLVEVLYGKQSPSGRLPYTVAKNESDYGELLDPIYPQADAPFYAQDNDTQGVFIDYKHFINEDIEPRFPFGFGLTYTEFEYSDLNIELLNASTSKYIENPVHEEGGITQLWDVLARVSVNVQNVGDVPAAEVAQLYVGIPEGLPKVLRGFDKQLIQPNATSLYTFELTRRDLSSWSVVDQQWVLESGEYQIYVGKDVLDIQLEDTLDIAS